jgi:hypothetical protein
LNNLNTISWLNIFPFDDHLKGKALNKPMIFKYLAHSSWWISLSLIKYFDV